jgi:hypothetical protein
LEQQTYTDATLNALKTKLIAARELVLKGVAFSKDQPSGYIDLHGRRLVDSAIAVLVGHFFLAQAITNPRKQAVARRFIDTRLATLRGDMDQVLSGDRTPLTDYATLAGPVPSVG